jgi:hypothetical protein
MSRKISSPLYFSILLAGVLLSACQQGREPATPESGTGAAPSKMIKGTSAIFIHRFTESNFPSPDTTLTGRFEVRDQCVVFILGDAVMRAVLPLESALTPDGDLAILGRSIALGEKVTVKGGEGEFGAPRSYPLSCPKRAALIGEIL